MQNLLTRCGFGLLLSCVVLNNIAVASRLTKPVGRIGSVHGKLPKLQPNSMTNAMVSQAQGITEQIQAGINAAVLAGSPSYTLPATTINLTNSIVIPHNSKNFTLKGVTGTILRRSISANFPLIIVGQDDTGAIDNGAFNLFPSLNIQPALEGSKKLIWTGGATPVKGWYALVGTHTVNDVIKIDSTVLTMACKRELVYVNAVIGNELYINQPLSRTFDNPNLRLLEPAGAAFANRTVPENIRITGITLNGRSTVDNVWTDKIIKVSRANNVTLDNLSLAGFNTTGISLSFCKGVTVDNVLIDDGNQSVLGYGIEVFASRFVTIRNSTFKKHRWGTVFQSGSSDALVEDCQYIGDINGGFDASHGGGEKRITFRRVLAPIYSICNPSWMRGASDILFENCTATRQFNIYSNAENIKIKGMYPGYNYTAPQIFMSTDGGKTGAIPAGVFGPKSVYLIDGALRRNTAEGCTMYFISNTGQAPAVGYLETNNYIFENQVTTNNVAVSLTSTNTNSVFKFNNSQFITRGPYGVPIFLGPSNGTGNWDITFNNSTIVSNWAFAFQAATAARGNITNVGSQINGTILDGTKFQTRGQMAFGGIIGGQ